MPAPNERFGEIAGVAHPKKMCNFAAEVARPNLCETPACVKPPPRWRQGVKCKQHRTESSAKPTECGGLWKLIN